MNQSTSEIRTFSIATLGCKVNQYESDQISALMQAYGLEQVPTSGDIQVVNTCSVTVQAASKSRQTVRRAGKTDRGRISGRISLPVVSMPVVSAGMIPDQGHSGAACITCDEPEIALSEPAKDVADETNESGNRSIFVGVHAVDHQGQQQNDGDTHGYKQVHVHAMDYHLDSVTDAIKSNDSIPDAPFRQPQIIVTGCWATSDPQAAADLPGVTAVITHHDDVLSRLKEFLGKILPNQGSFSSDSHQHSKARDIDFVNKKIANIDADFDSSDSIITNDSPLQTATPSIPDNCSTGTINLPLLSTRQKSHQRAFLKIQDGCDAHCTYCIIPQLRPKLWSKPIEDCVFEAQNMVDVGHDEIVLTGIFMGAFGQPTALRRYQEQSTAIPLGQLVDALCTKVIGLKRLRLSSLEPGDLNPQLLAILKSHTQVVPHFHLPLQSGSDYLLKRMNRQYTSSDFLAMIDQVQNAYDRPAFTTDIIVGFPGETDAEFEKTMDVARKSNFIHIHAFSYSARPKTAAARWKKDFVHGPIVNERICRLNNLAKSISYEYRKKFAGETVELLVEKTGEPESVDSQSLQHGRCERYFAVHFNSPTSNPGDLVRVRITKIDEDKTYGEFLSRRQMRGWAPAH